jgi:hypothetical protein
VVIDENSLSGDNRDTLKNQTTKSGKKFLDVSISELEILNPDLIEAEADLAVKDVETLGSVNVEDLNLHELTFI